MVGVKTWFGIPRLACLMMFTIVASFALVIILQISLQIRLHGVVIFGGIMTPQIYLTGYLDTKDRGFEIRRFWFWMGIVFMIVYSGFILFGDDIETGFKIAPDIQSFFIYNAVHIIFLTLMAIHVYTKRELRKMIPFI